MYIPIQREDLKPYTGKAKPGDTVIYKNLNGNYYKGVTETGLQWHTMLFMMPPHNRRLGIKCNFSNLVLVLEQEQLFQITAEK